jgi:hypothetical protein
MNEPAIHITLRLATLVRLARQLIFVILPLAIILAAAIIAIIARHKPAAALPSDITSQISSFHPYYIKPGTSTDFKLKSGSASYQNGILVFVLTRPGGNTLAFSEQRTPYNIEQAQLHTTDQFNTEYGAAYVTAGANRTTGALFTNNNTLIIINAPTPVGADTMQSILRSLVPVGTR